jgi:NAD(P)-dependent dehydrogenase (short-subunit alcohol dehydrogenase family)
MTNLADKVILITGAGSGLGRALAEACAAQGAIVAAHDVTPINLDETLARIAAAGGRARDYVFDIAKRMPVQALITQVLDDWGRIDGLINAIRVAPHDSILDMDEWDWRRTLDTNLSGPFFAMQIAGRAMQAQGGGVIVNMVSPGEAGQPDDYAAHAASQAGLQALTRSAASELAAFNIQVYHVSADHPGAVAQVLALLTNP